MAAAELEEQLSNSASSMATGELEEQLDFSELPDVAWVQILSYLPLEDRYRVSQCCTLLHEHFRHPSLWATIKIALMGDLNKYVWEKCSGAVLPQVYVHMIDKFGKYFHHLTLIYSGYLTTLPAHCARVLTALAEKCRLESLTMHVGGMITKGDFALRKARQTDMKSFCDIVTNAFRLKSFDLRSWPMYPGMTTADILVDLCGNPHLGALEELKLYWQSAGSGTWATQNAVVPSAEETLSVVTRFSQLKVLCLRSPMLCEEVITELARPHRAPLQRLGVLVCYSRHGGGIPEITCEAWRALTSRAPELVVDVTVVNRVPYVELAGLLLPEVPVFSVNFMKYARCGHDDVYSLSDKYARTLRKFVNYSDSGAGMDEALKLLVHKCARMTYLVHHGSVHADTVLRLARMRGRRWYRFEVFGGSIATNPALPLAAAEEEEEEEEEEDAVIRRGEDGDVYIYRPPAAHHSEEEQEECLAALSRHVAEILHQKWAPAGKEKILELLESERLVTSQVVSEKKLEVARKQAEATE